VLLDGLCDGLAGPNPDMPARNPRPGEGTLATGMPPSPERSPGAPAASAPPPGARILVVDDTEANRALLDRRLQRGGHVILHAADGMEALEQMRRQPVDLVLLDVLMPRLTGREVLLAMKADPALRHLPVIMISGLDDMQSLIGCIEDGAEDYLTKPFDPVLLNARIGASLERKRLRDSEQELLRKVREEQLKSETLLLNILPRTIADRLKAGESTIVDTFPGVSVLFADLAGFTQLSTRISASELVRLLDDLFTTFDLLAQRQGLEKIKTIGDAYMVVGGLPVPRADHAQAAAELALDMVAAVRERFSGGLNPVRIRIGISSGPVVAGVIGRHKFSYDLWGDTVNTASRMESLGEPDAIQVSAETHRLLAADYEFTRRELPQVKGKGDLTAWLLAGRRR
jgi:class 3 adenylate cyclase